MATLDDLFGPIPKAPVTPPPSQLSSQPSSPAVSSDLDKLFGPVPPAASEVAGEARPRPSGVIADLFGGFSRGVEKLQETTDVAFPVVRYQLFPTPENAAAVASSGAAIRKSEKEKEAGLAPVAESWSWDDILQSLGGAIPSAAATLTSGAIGGFAGSLGGPIGGAAGTLGGLALSGAFQANGSSFFDYLESKGVDVTNPQAITTALADPKISSEARAYAATRAGIDGLINAALGAGGGAIGRAGLSKVGTIAAESGLGVAGMGGGEAVHELAEEGTLDPSRVAKQALFGVAQGVLPGTVKYGALKLGSTAVRALRGEPVAPPPPIPSMWMKDAQGNVVRNPAAQNFPSTRDMEDPENKAVDHIMKAIATSPNLDKHGGFTKADVSAWRDHLIPNVPSVMWADTQVGRHMFEMLMSAKGELRPTDLQQMLSDADISVYDIKRTGVQANKNLEPDVQIVNPSSRDPSVMLKISTGTVSNKAGRVMIVDSAQRRLSTREIQWLGEHAKDKGIEYLAWRGDLLDAGYGKIGKEEVRPSFGKPETLKTVKIPRSDPSTDYWLPVSATNAPWPAHGDGAAPHLVMTGDPKVDAILVHPELQRRIADYKINREDHVPLEAGASEGTDNTTHIDSRIPQTFTTKSGKVYSPDRFLHIHEQIEKFMMEQGLSYRDSHSDYAIPAERAAVAAAGIDPGEYNAHMAGAYGAIKDKVAERSPWNLYREPYRQEGKEHLLRPGPKGDIAVEARAPLPWTPRGRLTPEENLAQSMKGRGIDNKQLAPAMAHISKVIQSFARAAGISKPIKIVVKERDPGSYAEANGTSKSYTISVDPSNTSSVGHLYEVMAHELGHIIQVDKLYKADTRTILAVLDEFQRWRDEVAEIANRGRQANRDVFDIISRSRAGAMEYLANHGIKYMVPSINGRLSPSSITYNRYWHSYSEWFAQQAARWSTSGIRPITEVDRFFSGLGRTIFRAVSRTYLNSNIKFEPGGLMRHYFDTSVGSINHSAYASIYEKIATRQKLANARALLAGGADPSLAQVNTPETQVIRDMHDRLFSGKPLTEWRTRKLFKQEFIEDALAKADAPDAPDTAQRFFGPIAAIADHINRFYKYTYSLPMLAEANKHISELVDYHSIIRSAEQERVHTYGIGAGTQFVKDMKRVNKQQRDLMYAGWDKLDRQLYRTQQEADAGISRNPTQAELKDIMKGMDSRASELFLRMPKLIDDQIENAANMWRADVAKHGTLIDQAQKLKDIDKFLAKVRSAPYFPHQRWGRYTVRVTDTAGNVHYWARAETRREQRRILREVTQSYPKKLYNHQTSLIKEESLPTFAIPPSLRGMAMAKLGFTMTDEQKATLQDLRYETSPPRPYRGQLQARNSLPGYSKDIVRAFSNYMFHGANYLVRTKYRDQLQGLIDDVDRQSKIFTIDGSRRAKIRDYMMNHFADWLNPKPDAWMLKSIAFHLYHGFLPKSAIVNLTQIPMQTYPLLASHFGHNLAVNALQRNMAQGSTYLRTASLAKGGFTEAKLKAMAEGVNEGVLTEALAPQLAAAAEGRNFINHYLGDAPARAWEWWETKSQVLFSASEHLARRLTFNAAYDLAHAKPEAKAIDEALQGNWLLFQRLVDQGYNIPEARAMTYAMHAVNLSQGTYARWARPRIFRGKLGALFMFKSFQHQFAYMMWNHPAAGVRAILITAFMGGMMGLPGMQDAADLLKAVAYKIFGKDFDLERETRKFIIDNTNGVVPPDLIVHGSSSRSFGLPIALNLMGQGLGMGSVPFPNTDLSSSVGFGQLNPVPLSPLFGPTSNPIEAVGQTAEHSAGAAFGLGFAIYHLISDPHNRGSWQNIIPRYAYNLMRAYEAYNDDLRGVTGARTVRFDPHDTEQMMEILGYAMGFRPSRLTEAQARNRSIGDAEMYWRVRREGLVRQFSTAIIEKNDDDKKSVLESVRGYNSSVPSGLGLEKITSKELINAAKARAKQVAGQEAGLGPSPARKNIPVAQDISRLYPMAKEVSRSVIPKDLRGPDQGQFQGGKF